MLTLNVSGLKRTGIVAGGNLVSFFASRFSLFIYFAPNGAFYHSCRSLCYQHPAPTEPKELGDCQLLAPAKAGVDFRFSKYGTSVGYLINSNIVNHYSDIEYPFSFLFSLFAFQIL